MQPTEGITLRQEGEWTLEDYIDIVRRIKDDLRTLPVPLVARVVGCKCTGTVTFAGPGG